MVNCFGICFAKGQNGCKGTALAGDVREMIEDIQKFV